MTVVFIMNWFFIPSYEQTLAAKKEASRDDKNQLSTKESLLDNPFHHNLLPSIKRSSSPANTIPNQAFKRDHPQSLEKRDTSDFGGRWHFPTTSSTEGNAKRTTPKMQKRDPSTEGHSSQASSFSKQKRENSFDSAKTWEFSSELSSMPSQNAKRDGTTSLKKRDTSDFGGRWHFPTTSSTEENAKRTTSKMQKRNYSTKGHSYPPSSFMKPKRENPFDSAKKWEFSSALSSTSSQNANLDGTTSLKKRDALDDGTLWHFPSTASSLVQNTKRTNFKVQKSQKLSKKRNFSTEKAYRWHYKRDLPQSGLKKTFSIRQNHSQPLKKRNDSSERLTPSMVKSMHSALVKKRWHYPNSISLTAEQETTLTSTKKRAVTTFAQTLAFSSRIRGSKRPWRFVDSIPTEK